MPAVATSMLSAEQIAVFHRLGFVALRELTTPADVEDIRRILMGLFARFHALGPRHAVDLGVKGRHRGRPQIPEINYTLELAPELRQTLAFARAQTIAEELLGCKTLHSGYDHAILKPSRTNRSTPWHQDQAYTRDRRRDALGSVHVWIPLQPVSVESGCMWFAPGTHRGPILPHHRRGHRRTAHALEASGVAPSRVVTCPLPAGGATVHYPRTLHATGPNLTDESRLAWILQFSVEPQAPRRAPWLPWLARFAPVRAGV
jgi:phytanoyl-CoA dioxygenase PhyH